MGGVFSAGRGHLKRLINKYNAENRALKFLDKGNIAAAPKHHEIDTDRILEENPHLKKKIHELHQKNETLDGYLKKVYLTSTTESSGVESKRKLPTLTEKTLKTIFFEPETPTPGSCTLTNIVEMMVKFRDNPGYWNAKTLAEHYKMDQKSIVCLLTYYSLFKLEDLKSLNDEPENVKKEEKEVTFEVYSRLEKKPVKQIEGKN